MIECKKCKNKNVVSNSIQSKIESGNDFHVHRDFGKIDIVINVCWCADCGEPQHDYTSILNISKISNIN